MKKMEFYKNRTLKLSNVLIKKCHIQEELGVLVQQIQSHIKVKGAVQIGPLVQYANSYINENGEMVVDIRIMLQCNSFIHSVEQPYTMESIVRIPNCMYCRYIGPTAQLKYAYDKIQLEAFENDIPLKGDSYTIFVDRDEENDTITADVFMERAD